MVNRTGTRVVLGLVFAVSAIGMMAAPAAAETVLKSCTGGCGDWQVDDAAMPRRGASCFYQGNFPYNLKQISVRPPLIHGEKSTKTKVGWRYLIQRKSVNGGSWNTQYTSTYQTAMANDQVPAYDGHGFSRRAYNVSHPQGYWWRVVLDLRWYNAGPDGMLRLKYDWYKRSRPGAPFDVQPDHCIQAF